MRYKCETFEKFREFKNEVEKKSEKEYQDSLIILKKRILKYRVHTVPKGEYYFSSIDSSLHTSNEWCVEKEKLYLTGHGAIYEEFLETSNIPLGICA